MSLLSIVEASKQFNITRLRIYRALEKGTITAQIDADGVKRIDPTDLVRVFGSAKQKKHAPNKSDTIRMEQTETVVEILREQLKQAQEREQFYKAEIANIRKDFDDYKLLIGMKQNPEIHSPSDVPKEQEEHVPIQENNTIQTGQVEQRNDTVTQDKTTKRRGLFGRVLNAVFDD